jgi:hypothetical protein
LLYQQRDSPTALGENWQPTPHITESRNRLGNGNIVLSFYGNYPYGSLPTTGCGCCWGQEAQKNRALKEKIYLGIRVFGVQRWNAEVWVCIGSSVRILAKISTKGYFCCDKLKTFVIN